MLFLKTSVSSQESSERIIESIRDTTENGRPFYIDAYDDPVEGILYRMDRVSGKQVLKINADRVRASRMEDSLLVQNQLLKDNFEDCQLTNKALRSENNLQSKQLELREQMLSNSDERNDKADDSIKILNRKATAGKIGWSFAGVFFAVATVETIILILRK